VLPSGQLVEGTAYVEDYTEDNESNQQLEITEKVSTSGEAKILAAKYLRLHNKYAKYASITFPGNPALVSGVTILLEGWGHWDGKYIAVEARHTVSNSGYTTTVKARAVLEGY
jgi:phage protein D